MKPNNSKQKQAKILRLFRKVHRTTGAFLFLFFFIISITGLLLGWKNTSNGLILPVNQKGGSSNLAHWLPIDSLHKKACFVLQEATSPSISLELDRIDIRKNNGMVKFVFKNHYWEVQLDGATGELLQLSLRQSDFIENIHDGSFLDNYFGTSGHQIKVVYTSIMGMALLLFTTTGFWLWYGPKKMRRNGA